MPATPALYQEAIDPGEAQLIDRIVELQRRLHDKGAEPVRRAQHPKHHALAAGELAVAPGLDDDLRFGLFGERRSYPAWVRFSNARGDDDARPGIRGLALKVTGIDHLGRPDQDFLAIDNQPFFVKDVQEYINFFEFLERISRKSFLGALPLLAPGLNPSRGVLPTLRRIARLPRLRGSLLNPTYHSNTPYRLGPAAIKFAFVPRPINGGEPEPGKTGDFLRERLVAHLGNTAAAFDLRVQFQLDPATMPVEDATVDWDWARPASPWRTVATLHLPPQVPDSPHRMGLAENLSFDPWHTLEAHRPIGGVNRARKPVYDALSRDRVEANGLADPAMPPISPLTQDWPTIA